MTRSTTGAAGFQHPAGGDFHQPGGHGRRGRSANTPVVAASSACASRISASETVREKPPLSITARRASSALLGVRTEMESATVRGSAASRYSPVAM